MVQVVWTRRALADLQAIHGYSAQFAPIAAQRTARRLEEAGISLKDFPERGRLLPGSRRRELVSVRPYLLRYRIVGDRLEILTIRHGARRPAP